MRRIAFSLATVALAFPFLAIAPAQATSSRTWVSGLGTDSGACTRASPCATFQFAHDQTTAGGEINCVDAGNYGPASGQTTITKSITISCEAGTAGIALTGGSNNGIVIDAAPSDVVTLRGLDIDGRAGGGGVGGIVLRHAIEVHIEKCVIRNVVGGDGILISGQASETMFVFVVNTVISDNSNGFRALSTGGFKVVSFKNVVITGSTNDGVILGATNVFANVTESIISANGGSAVRVAFGSSTANIDRTTMANNGTALNAAASGAIIRTIGNNVFNNTNAVSIAAGATVVTDGQNRSGGNTNTQAPNASASLF